MVQQTLTPRQREVLAELVRRKKLADPNRCLWPKEFEGNTIECATAFVFECWTQLEAGGTEKPIPDWPYIREYIRLWWETRESHGVLITEKCRRMVISWLSRALELWDMGRSRNLILLLGEDYDAAAKHVWRYEFLYKGLQRRHPEWNLEDCKTLRFEGERKLKQFALSNGSVANYGNGEDRQVQGEGASAIIMEELPIYPYGSSVLAQAKILIQGEGGVPKGYIHAIGNACAQNKDWQTMKQSLLAAEPSVRMKGLQVRRANRDLFCELDWFADANRDEAWLASVREEMASTPFKFREQILRQDTYSEGALWDYDTLNANRVAWKDLPQMVAIALSVDPSVSDPEKRKNPSKESDECGIVVVGLGADSNAYVLKDLSIRAKPETWAQVAMKSVNMFAAGFKNSNIFVAAEDNQGGEMVRMVLEAVSKTVPIRLVRSQIGKRARAEPVAVLTTQGRVKFAGYFNALEREMTTWDAQNPSAPSPNRIDALVQAVTALGLCDEMVVRENDDSSRIKFKPRDLV